MGSPSDPRTLLLLGGGPEQCVAVEVARELGYLTLVVDDDPHAPAAALADRFLASRLKDPERLVSDLAGLPFHGVFTHAAELAIEQARVAEIFGLRGLSVDAAARGTLKHLRIGALRAAGLTVPDHEVVEPDAPAEDWHAAAQRLDYPLVAKPVDEKGARGVRRVASAGELDRYRDARGELASSPCFLLETLEEGLEISSESVVVEGRCDWHSFALRHYDGMERFHPYLIEDGHSLPLDLEPELQRRLEEAIVASAAAIGVRSGVLKGDLLVRADGTPVVLEMAVRTSGGRFADLVTPLGTGVHVLHSLIRMAMGDPVEPGSLEPRWRRGVSQRFLFLPEGTRAARRPQPHRHLVRPGVRAVEFSQAFLRTLRQAPVRSHHDRIGYVVCVGADRAEADARALALARELEEELS
jgi:biotin carboxylase